MIGRRQAAPWWLSAAGESRIKDSYQFSVFGFRLKGPAGKIPLVAKTLLLESVVENDNYLASFGSYHKTGEIASYDPKIRMETCGRNSADI